jgi:hypothetical protein
MHSTITVTLHLTSGHSRRSVVLRKPFVGRRATKKYTDSFKEFNGRSLKAVRTNGKTTQSKSRKVMKRRFVRTPRISSLSLACPAAPFNSTESLMDLRQESPICNDASVYGLELDFYGSAASMFGGFKQDA